MNNPQTSNVTAMPGVTPKIPQNHVSIEKRLYNIMADCEQIPKTGWNRHHKYHYVKAVDIIREVKKLLLRNQVGFIVDEKEIERVAIGDNLHCRIRCEASFYCINYPDDRKDVTYYAEASDRLDKAIYKAKTNGIKYLFAIQFLIDSDEIMTDAEQTSQGDREIPSQDGRPPIKQPAKQLSKGYGPKNNNRGGRATFKQQNYINSLQQVVGLAYTEQQIKNMTSKEASDAIEYLMEIQSQGGHR